MPLKNKDSQHVRERAIQDLRNDILRQNTNKININKLKRLRGKYTERFDYYTKQLESTFQNVVDDMNVVLTRLDSSVQQLDTIHRRFDEIDSTCKTTKEHFQNFELIQKVARARNNIKTTLRVETNFSSIPKLSGILLEKIEQDDEEAPRLRHYYLELRNLVNLRDRALEKLEEDENREEKEADILQHFHSLDECARAIEMRIQYFFSETLYFVENFPNSLLQCLIICEFEDTKNEKRILDFTYRDWEDWRKDDYDESTDISSKRAKSSESMQEKIKGEMEMAIQTHLMDILNIGQDESHAQFRENAEEVLDDMQNIVQTMGQIFPDSYDIVSFYITRYMKWLWPKIMERLDGQKNPSGKLAAAKWVEEELNPTLRYIKSQLGSEVAREIDQMTDTIQDSNEDLQKDFVAEMKDRVSKFVQNVAKMEYEKRDEYVRMVQTEKEERDGLEGHPFTYGPIDLFGNALNPAWNTAVNDHTGKMFYDLVDMMLDLLEEYRRSIYKDLTNCHLLCSTKYMVAHVNNTLDLQQRIMEKKDELFEDGENESASKFQMAPQQVDTLKKNFDDCQMNFATLTSEMQNLLVNHIMLRPVKAESTNIKQLFNSLLFSNNWCKGLPPLFLEDIIQYIGNEVFYERVAIWLKNPSTYFRTLSKVCFQIVDHYIVRFEEAPIDCKKLDKKLSTQHSEHMIGKQICTDAEDLLETFQCENFMEGFPKNVRRIYKRQVARTDKGMAAQIEKLKVIGTLMLTDQDALGSQVENTLDAFGEKTETIYVRVMTCRNMKKKHQNQLKTQISQLMIKKGVGRSG